MVVSGRLVLLIFSMLLLAQGSIATEWIVAPDGSPSGTGTLSKPWNLQTALNHPASVKPGDTIWLRGGDYHGTFQGNLQGTIDKPIIVRSYPGEWARLDGDLDKTYNAVLETRSKYTWYWGFEVFSSSLEKRGGWPAGSHVGVQRPNGITTWGIGDKFINLVVHDTRQGFSYWVEARDNEVYGVIDYYDGWSGSDRGHGHSMYSQNKDGYKYIKDGIFFMSHAIGPRVYGTEAAYGRNFLFEGNTVFESGYLHGGNQSRWSNILVTVGSRAENITVRDSNYYMRYNGNTADGWNEIGWISYGNAQKDVVVENNRFMGGEGALGLIWWDKIYAHGNTVWSHPPNGAVIYAGTKSGQSFSNYDWDYNTYYGTDSFKICTSSCQQSTVTKTFEGFKSQTGVDAHSTFTPGRPKGVWTYVRPNKYEQGRAHITIYNWDLKPTVTIDLSETGLTSGQDFEIRDALNYFGPSLYKGKYNGGTVTLSTALTEMSPPVGSVRHYPMHTAPEFLVFVVVPTGAGAGQIPESVAVPTITPNGGVFANPTSITLQSTTSGAEIRYTTDGTSPSATSKLYTGPFTMDVSGQIQARGFKSGMLSSNIVSSQFTITASDKTAPVVTNPRPQGTLSSGTINTVVGVSTNEPANCRYAITSGVAYNFMTPMATTGGLTHDLAVTNLVNQERYDYFIKCQDLAGNTNLADTEIAFLVGGLPSGEQSTVFFEAEAGVVSAPMTVVSDSSANGGLYVVTPTANSGKVTFDFTIAKGGEHYIWTRIKSKASNEDSFTVVMDGSSNIFDTAEQKWSSSWQWVLINGRNGNQVLAYDPRKFQLSTGTHKLEILGRDANTQLDRLIITNDPSFDPTSSTPTNSCGDATCNNGETCSTCAADCGSCTVCGDSVCSGSETCSSCAQDCSCSIKEDVNGDSVVDISDVLEIIQVMRSTTAAGTRDVNQDGKVDVRDLLLVVKKIVESEPRCGDGFCNGIESCNSCGADCGSCQPTQICGDGTCNSQETCSSCSADCGTCSGTAQIIRINSGGTATEYTDIQGKVWQKDQYYVSGGNAYSSYVTGTDAQIYKTGRYGLYSDFSYQVPVQPGTYKVTLKFAEMYVSKVGQRVFDVSIEGNTVLSNFDILNEVGVYERLDKTFTVQSDSTLDIDFIGVRSKGIVSAIEIIPQ